MANPTAVVKLQVECTTRAQWRAWLAKYHSTSSGVWLVTFKKAAGDKYLAYAATVEEALCFGWIDSKPGKVDAERTKLYFSPRKPRSGWAKPNKIRIAKLLAAGRMRPAGIAAVELAKSNGTWTMLDEIEADIAPAELESALDAHPRAREHFDRFPPSIRRGIYQWIVQAKRPETKAKRVAETVESASQNIRANQYRPGGEGAKKPGG